MVRRFAEGLNEARITARSKWETQPLRPVASQDTDSRPGVANGIVIELITPNENFWGVDLQVNKTTLELQNLETALRCEDIDLHLMREYRNAVDNIRTITATLQQLRKCQFHGSDTGELLSVLATGRIQRASNLCLEAIADIDAGHVKQESKTVDELKRAIQHLQQRLRQGSKTEATVRLNASSEE